MSEKVYFEDNADEASRDISRTRDTSFNRSDSYDHNFSLSLNQRFSNRTFLSFFPSFTLTDNRSAGQQVTSVFSREDDALKTRTGTSNRSKETGFSSSGRLTLFTPLRKPKPTAADTTRNIGNSPPDARTARRPRRTAKYRAVSEEEDSPPDDFRAGGDRARCACVPEEPCRCFPC